MDETVRVDGVEVISASDSALNCRIAGREIHLPRPPVRIESIAMGLVSLRVPIDIARENGLSTET